MWHTSQQYPNVICFLKEVERYQPLFQAEPPLKIQNREEWFKCQQQKIRSKWVEGLLEFFGITAGTTVLKITESGIEANVIGNVSGYALKSAAVTATATGTTTGIIPEGVTHAVVTSSVNTKLITLPAPVPGLVVTIVMTANGGKLKLRTCNSQNKWRGGRSASSAISANTEVVAICMSSTSWKAWTVAADGTLAALAAAA